MRIEELDQPDDWKRQFLEFAREPYGFVLFAGKNGTGKTTAAYAIMGQANVDRGDPKFDFRMGYTQVDLFMEWTKVMKQFGEVSYFYERLATAYILLLDDVGTRAPSEAYKDFIYAIIEKRERNKDTLGTIITTNLNSSEMREMFGDAIVSRVASGKVFRFEGKDRRFKDF